jgi:hypothetical protein
LEELTEYLSNIDTLIQLETLLPPELRTLSKVPYGWDLQNLDLILLQDGTAKIVCKVYNGEKHIADGLIVSLEDEFEDCSAFPLCLFFPFDDEHPRFPRS